MYKMFVLFEITFGAFDSKGSLAEKFHMDYWAGTPVQKDDPMVSNRNQDSCDFQKLPLGITAPVGFLYTTVSDI